MVRVGKALVFAHLSLVILVIGAFAAQRIWYFSHHRYDDPATGFYYGMVNARFQGDADDCLYTFNFRGRSEPRWQWLPTTNYSYKTLELEWHRFGAIEPEDSRRHGTLHLDSLQISDENGILSENLLSTWLLGHTNASPNAQQQMKFLYNLMIAARDGTLPQPRHHGHHFTTPVSGSIQHFRLGIGVASYVYLWIYLWTLAVFVATTVVLNRRHRVNYSKFVNAGPP